MKRFFILFILLSLGLSITIVSFAQDDLIQIAQWASKAEASSQFTDESWSANRASGEPDVLVCEDSVNAWASAEIDAGEEWLTLYYSESVIPTQINIYQSYNPGAIVRVELSNTDEDEAAFLATIDDPGDDCPGALSLNLPDGLPEINKITIVLDQRLTGDSNEIDAVELVGLAEGNAEDAQESSIESEAYPEYYVFSTTGSDEDTSSSNADLEWGRTVSCEDGGEILDGVEVSVIQQRSGGQYTFTAIGIDGFDPSLAVTLRGEYEDATCSDDSDAAAAYSANLPTTGQISESSFNSQIVFNLDSDNDFEDVSVIVGGFEGSSGEFLLIIEGMFADEFDGDGDPFALQVSPALYEYLMDPTVYMISVVGSFDPQLFLSNDEGDELEDEDGNLIYCDDAGDENLCWGENEELSDYYVSRSNNRQLQGGSLDSMLTLPLFEEDLGAAQYFLMTGNASFGDYVAAFHLAVQSGQ